MSPADAAPNGNHMYLYLQNGQENVVKYDDCSSHFRLWYPEQVAMSVMYSTPSSLSSISFNNGPLCKCLLALYCIWPPAVDNSDSPSVVEQLQQGHHLFPILY